MTQSPPVSLWETTAAETAQTDPFTADTQVDVAIIGGGFTGLSTALHCADLDLSVQVIEAQHLGYGGSGRNAGLVNASAWLPPDGIRKSIGETYGDRFIKTFSKAPSTVFELIEKHQIRCEVTKTGSIHAAHAPSGLEDLKARHAQWAKLGEPVDLLTRDEMAEMTGSTAFYGGLLDHRAGSINPMGYCLGLARAARGAGAKISTGIKATKLTQDNGEWRVETDRGSIRAKNVVLGTNAYSDDLWPGLKDVFSIIHYLQVATKPLGEDAAHILPKRQPLWDTGTIMFSARRDMADRLIVGTMGRVVGSKDAGLTRIWARKEINRVFPGIGPIEFDEAWHGQIAMTPDHMAKVHQLAPGLWTPIAYNGRGITTGTIFGAAIAQILTGADPDDLPLPVTEPDPIPGAQLKSRFYDLAFSANQLWKSLT